MTAGRGQFEWPDTIENFDSYMDVCIYIRTLDSSTVTVRTDMAAVCLCVGAPID